MANRTYRGENAGYVINSKAIDIARQFCTNIQEALTRDQFWQMIERNKCESDNRICHSHDFCDANVLLAEAFAKVMKRELDTQSDADLRLWSEAWAIAKEADFYA